MEGAAIDLNADLRACAAKQRTSASMMARMRRKTGSFLRLMYESRRCTSCCLASRTRSRASGRCLRQKRSEILVTSVQHAHGLCAMSGIAPPAASQASTRCQQGQETAARNSRHEADSLLHLHLMAA